MRHTLIFSLALFLLLSPQSIAAANSAAAEAVDNQMTLSKQELKKLKAQRDSLRVYLKEAKYYTNNKSAQNFTKARQYLKKAFSLVPDSSNMDLLLQAANTEYRCFQIERNKPATGGKMNVEVIYASTLAGFRYYTQAYALDKANQANGGDELSDKVKQRAMDEAYDLFRTTRGFRANAGYYYSKKDYKTAYANYTMAKASLDNGLLRDFAVSNAKMSEDFKAYSNDSVRRALLYSCAVTAVLMQDNRLAIKELEAAKSCGIETNKLYQLLCQKYLAVADTTGYERTLKEADRLLPEESWYAQNLLNLYLATEKHDSALTVIDEVIHHTPGNARNVELKGMLLDEAGNAVGAEQAFKTAVSLDSTLLNSYSALGRIYFNRALDREKVMIEERQFDDIYDVCVPLYELALPFYDKAFLNDTKREDKSIPEAIRTILFKKFQSPKCKNSKALIRRYNEVSKAYGLKTL